MSVSRGDVDRYYDLGTYHRRVDTPSPQAQIWTDRGLVWAYAFNHDDAIRCFERALELDPDLAIARWGIAYGSGRTTTRRGRRSTRSISPCRWRVLEQNSGWQVMRGLPRSNAG